MILLAHSLCHLLSSSLVNEQMFGAVIRVEVWCDVSSRFEPPWVILSRRTAILDWPVPFGGLAGQFDMARISGVLHGWSSRLCITQIPYRWDGWVRRRSSGGRPASAHKNLMGVHLGTAAMIRAMELYMGPTCDVMWATPVHHISEPIMARRVRGVDSEGSRERAGGTRNWGSTWGPWDLEEP